MDLEPAPGGRALRHAAGFSVLATAGLVGCSAMVTPRNLTLPPAVSGERRQVEGRAGRVTCYVAGAGSPILLLHSINAAGSAYEVRPLFERLKDRYRVYACDLPGFGFSDRSDRRYDVRLYVDAIHDMLDAVETEHGSGPVDALAVSLSSEFLARAALERPERLRSVALVTPTGFSRAYERLHGPEGATREVPGLYGFFTFPVWSSAFYNLLTSRPSIRYFLQKTFGRKDIDEDLLDYDYRTTHQPGAKNAPYAFVSGRLFSRDIRSVYERLTLPVWMPHGTKGDFQDFTGAGWTKTRPNWTVQPFPTGALPHFEQPAEFLAAYERFLAAQAGSAYSSLSDARSPSP